MTPSLGRLARGALLRAVHRIAPTEAETAVRFLEARTFAAFPKRNVTVTADVPVGRVLILSPHPDDEAIGMGGALAMHAANGSDVTVLYMTDGGGLDEPREEMIRTRRAEAEALGADLGVKQVFWDNVDTRLTNDAPTVEAMLRVLEELQPEHVYAPSMLRQLRGGHLGARRRQGGGPGALRHPALLHGFPAPVSLQELRALHPPRRQPARARR
jgi:hypothetical protein